jgi:hypothetical protein
MATINIVDNSSAPFTVSSGDLTVTSGNAIVTSGNVTLPTTTSSVGQILLGGSIFLHAYGTDNVFVGPYSGNFRLTGTENTCAGSSTGIALTSGTGNTLIGYETGWKITSGSYNTLLGWIEQCHLTTGSYNLIIGSYSTGSGYTSSESSNILLESSGTTGESNVMRLGHNG